MGNPMYLVMFSVIASVISLILCCITAIFSFKAYASVVGLQNSTHQISYVPLEEELGKEKAEAEKAGMEPEDYQTMMARQKEELFGKLEETYDDHL
jgi:hypothetical protein